MKLQWADVADPSEKDVFLAEILLFCEDRKKLLADCSEVVSELSSIFLTGSSSSEEHATLVFLIRVTSVDHLQHVMDSLVEIPSVMSVERRVSCHQQVFSCCLKGPMTCVLTMFSPTVFICIQFGSDLLS
jgi:hypothetical protein